MHQFLLILYWIYIFLFTWKSISCEITYETDDDNAHGLRISGNDQFTVYAMNRFGSYVISYAPFLPDHKCQFQSIDHDLYVYSLDVLYNNNNETSNELFTFIQIAEQTSTQNVYITLITLNKSSCINQTTTNIMTRNTLIWNGTHQQYMLIKVIPSQNYACIFADSFILIFDIMNNCIHELKDTKTFYPLHTSVVPHAIDVTNQWISVAAYIMSPEMANVAAPVVFICQFQPLKYLTYMIFLDQFAQTIALGSIYNLANHMSISINDERQMIICGYPLLSIVILFSVNTTSLDTSQWTINRTRMDIGPRNSGFGQSVAWLNQQTVAITVLSSNTRPWSQSEVWTFAIDMPMIIPLYIFPNNQQYMFLPPSVRFYQTLSWSGHLYILTDFYQSIFIPSSAPGYQSVGRQSREMYLIIFDSIPCMSGTYKNDYGSGICTICPPQTKNPGNQPCIECNSCSLNSFCPLASINNISFTNYSSYTQTFAYPDSPDMNNYDDILVQNIFSFGNSSQCLVIAPLFWTSIAMLVCLIIWLIMTIGKVCKCRMIIRHRDNAKKFLKNTDIVGEGERWIGGLFSFVIAVLFGFTFWFAADYLSLYPIETSGRIHASCDDTMRNALFDNALQLPLSNTDGSRWAIFDMLERQPLTMTLDLINTGADCRSLTIQQNRPGVNFIRLSNLSCRIQPDNATLSATFPLPTHQLTVQLNVTGAYSIGGIRLCLRGPSDINGVNTLQTLDMCQLFFTRNETLARTSTLSVVLIKVINQTKPLRIGDETFYSGRWAPTFGESSYSDKLIYEQEGEYLRYINERITITIQMSEQTFFLQNNQKPIVRIAELAFHTLLFCTLIMELFAIAFLLFKLIVKPLIRLCLHCQHSKQRHQHQMRKQQPRTSFRLERRHQHKLKSTKEIVYDISSNLSQRNHSIVDNRTMF